MFVFAFIVLWLRMMFWLAKITLLFFAIMLGSVIFMIGQIVTKGNYRGRVMFWRPYV